MVPPAPRRASRCRSSCTRHRIDGLVRPDGSAPANSSSRALNSLTSVEPPTKTSMRAVRPLRRGRAGELGQAACTCRSRWSSSSFTGSAGRVGHGRCFVELGDRLPAGGVDLVGVHGHLLAALAPLVGQRGVGVVQLVGDRRCSAGSARTARRGELRVVRHVVPGVPHVVHLGLQRGVARLGEDVLDRRVRRHSGWSGTRCSPCSVRPRFSRYSSRSRCTSETATPVPRPSVVAYMAGEIEPTCDCIVTRCRV